MMKTFEFFFRLNIGHWLFSHLDNLSKTLQAEKMSACSSKRTANLVVTVLQNLRNEESFNQIYELITTKSKAHYFVKEPVLSQKTKAPNYSILHYLDGIESNTKAYHPETARDRY